MAVPPGDPARSRRPLAAAAVLAVLAAVAVYLLLGTPGIGPAGDLRALAPQEFAQRLESDAFVVNVHVPLGPGIAGTDEAIAYDRLAGDDRLPEDRDEPILLYCETGRMSLAAGRELLATGYTDVAHLDGGMQAWQAAGYDLVEG